MQLNSFQKPARKSARWLRRITWKVRWLQKQEKPVSERLHMEGCLEEKGFYSGRTDVHGQHVKATLDAKFPCRNKGWQWTAPVGTFPTISRVFPCSVCYPSPAALPDLITSVSPLLRLNLASDILLMLSWPASSGYFCVFLRFDTLRDKIGTAYEHLQLQCLPKENIIFP